MMSLAKTASNYDACIRMRVLGNAIGNSIVDKLGPQSTSSTLARRNGANANAMTSDDVLEEVQVTATRRELSANPDNVIRAGSNLSGDQQRAIAAAQEEGMTLPNLHLENLQIGGDATELEEIVVTGRRWNDIDDRNLVHLTTPFLYGVGGMVDDHGEEIARRTMQMTDMGFDPLRQRQDLAILNEAFTPWGQAIGAGVGIYNTGVKALAGAASLFDLPNGVDRAVGTQNAIRDALSINLDSPLANAIAPNFANLSPAARVGLELVGDGLALAPALAGLRSVTADMSLVNRALQMPITIGDNVPNAFRQSGASSFRFQSLFKSSLDDALKLPLEKQLLLDRDIQAAIFRNNMGDAPFEGAVGHHVIPLEARTRLPELMQKAAKGGFDINGVENGAWLKQVDHYGGHPKYNALVIQRLERISPNLSTPQTATRVKQVLTQLQSGIAHGTYRPWE